MQPHARLLFPLTLFALMALIFTFARTPTYAQPSTPDDQLLARLGQDAGGPVQAERHAETGKLRFLALDARHPAPRARSLAASATPEQASRQFLATYGTLFGLRDQAQELTVMHNEALASRAFVRFQQTYKGVPVLAGELIVQSDKNRNIVSANGEVLPDLSLSVQPRIDSAAAEQVARAVVAKTYGLSAASLRATSPRLWIYNPALLGGPGLRRSSLVWRTELTAPASATPVRELVLVDAQLGAIALHFNQIADAKERHVCNDNNKVVDTDENPDNNCTPNKYVLNEGGSPTGNADVDLAYEFSGITYDFYRNTFGRDSLDGKGLPLVSLVKYCPSEEKCNFKNAFWDGHQMSYGDGYASADDVVGHELTHGFTQFTSGLYYYYQSGAINESMSDVFGELIDLTDGVGNDAANVRWKVGEDLPQETGVIRDMSNPPAFENPDSTSSVYYNGDSDDSGGVHTNSGVNNKAAYLMTEGGTFHGVTVTGIGALKTAAVYYTVEVAYLTSGSDYQDLYSDLQAACATLASTGAFGVTTADCGQVKAAGDATEMNITPEAAPQPKAAVCPAGQTSSDLFYDDLENPANGNWVSAATSGTINEWYYPAKNNPHEFDAQYATSGVGNMWANDYGPVSNDPNQPPDPPVADYNIAMTGDVTLPANALFHFRHAFEFESDLNGDYDGGVVEYSTNGGASWQDVGPLFTDDSTPYNVELSDGPNPLAGRDAFGSVSQGYLSSKADLSTLAGQKVRFRFRVGTDKYTDGRGWFIDDIRIYTCTSAPPSASIKLANQTVAENGGSANVEVTLSGVTSQDVTIPFSVSGTASPGQDYILLGTTLTIPAGQSSGKIVLTIINDTVADPNETISVTLGTPTGATIGAASTHTLTIRDNDYFVYLPVVVR